MTSRRRRLAVFASGRGSNFKAIAESCSRDDFPARVGCLVTDKPEAGAVGIAEEFGIPCRFIDAGKRRGRLSEDAERELVSICQAEEIEFVFLAGFMRILSGPILDEYAGKIINIHPSLLPSFKGLHAQRQALEYGVRVAGCTVHFVDASVDGGPIILQAAVDVEGDDDEETLANRILIAEHRIAVRAVELLALDELTIDGRSVHIKG